MARYKRAGFHARYFSRETTTADNYETYPDRNAKLCTMIQQIAEGLNEFSTGIDALGDTYEYLIGQFAAGSGKEAGELHTPQQISDIFSTIVTLDSQELKTGPKKWLTWSIGLSPEVRGCKEGVCPFTRQPSSLPSSSSRSQSAGPGARLRRSVGW